MDREALGTYKGVFEHMGIFGASGDIKGVKVHGGIQIYMGGVPDAPNIWWCQFNAPKL